MPNATRKICDFPGCTRGPLDANEEPTPYITPAGLQQREEVNADLREHLNMAHELPLKHAESEVKKLAAETAKIEAENQRILLQRDPAEAQQQQPLPQQPQQLDRRDKIPRPVIDEGINQSDWTFFRSQWDRYVLGTSLSGNSVLLHLWEACTESLQRALYQSGAGTIQDPKVLLNTIQTLAVKSHNNLVNILELQKMGQQRGETITAFSARLNGQASLCNLNVECPDCHKDVSFKEKILMYQTIRGLDDKEAIQRVLQSAAQVEGAS